MISEDVKNNTDNLLRYRERIANFSKEFEVGLFIYLLRKSRWIILSIILLAIFSANMYLRYTPKRTQQKRKELNKAQRTQLSTESKCFCPGSPTPCPVIQEHGWRLSRHG